MQETGRGREEDLGSAPQETHDRDFAPVLEGSDARGRTEPAESARRPDDLVSGTGVPGVPNRHPESGATDERGVREAERDDATREYPEELP